LSQEHHQPKDQKVTRYMFEQKLIHIHDQVQLKDYVA
jgi:hypothetical protein